jgi:hypothetical protein
MNKKICLGICLLFLSYGCASHKAVRQPDLSYDLKAQENKIDRDGLILMVKAFHLKSELTTYFDDDLLKYSILPVQINIQNKSYPNAVVMSVDGINLIDPTGTRSPGLSCDLVYNKVKRSQWRSVGWGVAFGLIGAIPSMLNVSSTNDKIRADLESRMIKNGNIVCGGATEGLAFFSIPEDLSNLSGLKIAVMLKDIQKSKDIILEYGLTGNLVPPKERREEEEKGEKNTAAN